MSNFKRISFCFRFHFRFSLVLLSSDTCCLFTCSQKAVNDRSKLSSSQFQVSLFHLGCQDFLIPRVRRPVTRPAPVIGIRLSQRFELRRASLRWQTTCFSGSSSMTR